MTLPRRHFPQSSQRPLHGRTSVAPSKHRRLARSWCSSVPVAAHVGLYAGEDDTHYNVLGGNQSNSVSVARIEKSRLVAIRWPKTGGEPVGGRVFNKRATTAVSAKLGLTCAAPSVRSPFSSCASRFAFSAVLDLHPASSSVPASRCRPLSSGVFAYEGILIEAVLPVLAMLVSIIMPIILAPSSQRDRARDRCTDRGQAP